MFGCKMSQDRLRNFLRVTLEVLLVTVFLILN